MMLHFTRSLDVETALFKILDEVQPSSDGETNLRVVGQEQNHVLLLAWDALLPFSSPKKLVSYIGSFHPQTKVFTKLYTFETKVSIRQCSLSQDGSLIAYTTYSHEQCCYSAFLAEIHNRIRTCIYSLNLQHDSLIKVKFLWPQRSSTDHLARESKLLVFLHNKSIGLYTINLRRTGSSMVLHKLPIAEQVCGRFFWAQWDKLGQRLYIVTRRKSRNGKTRNIFKCLEFSLGGRVPSSPVMVLELPFDLKEHHYADRCGPHDDPLSDVVSGGSLNIQVITQSQGVFCICYQLIHQKRRPLEKTISSPILGSSPNPTSKLRVSVPEFDAETTAGGVSLTIPMTPSELQLDLRGMTGTTQVDVAYSIFCVHNSHLISAVAHGVPLEKARGMKLFFGPQDGYVLVYSPGVVQHLVNVTTEFPPCHHLALDPEVGVGHSDSPGSSVAISDRLGLMTCEQTSRSGTCIYDITNRVAYQYSWMKPLPCHSLYPSLAESALHYVNIQARDHQLREELMSHLTQDPSDLGLWQVFIEFILSSTYAAVRKQVEDRDILQNFPFTTDLRDPQLVMTGDGDEVATFSSQSCACKVEISDVAIQRKFSNPASNPYLFSRLKTHITDLRGGGNEVRYSVKNLREKIDGMMEGNMSIPELTPSKEVQTSPQTPNLSLRWATESVKKKLTIPGRRRRKSPSPAPEEPTVVPVQTEDDWRYDRINLAHIDALLEYLQGRLTHMSSEKLRQIATTYCNCQIQQVQQLISILVWSVGLDDKGALNVWDTSLDTRASDQEQRLFMMMERLFVAMEMHCLQCPQDFPTQLTCLGFRCLDSRTFIDYLSNGALQLSKAFLQKLLRDLPDNDANKRAVKMKLINFLSAKDPVLGNEMLVSWDHPEGNAVLTRLHLEQRWFSDSSKADLKDLDQPESPASSFPPLASLLKHATRLGKEPSSSPSALNQGAWLPSTKIASAALFNSVQKYGEDLMGFTF